MFRNVPRHHFLSSTFTALILLSLVACAPESVAPTFDHVPAADVVPFCEQGCVESDSFPAQPGIFLGSGVTLDVCYGHAHTDTDGDLLSDFCEKNLAAAFAPELAYSSTDDVSREPHWVAGPLLVGGEFAGVRIGYLLSYHVDRGTDDPACENQIADQWCRGHYGDSEAIFLDVYYRADWAHWILNAAYYSAHENYNWYQRTTKEYPAALTYPDKKGGYPRAYVAYNKHANYKSEADCDSGGAFGFDTCLTDSYARVSAGEPLNLGSRSSHSAGQDCMGSSDPLFEDNGEIECYWTGSRFGGWIGTLPDAEGYSSRLAEWGF